MPVTTSSLSMLDVAVLEAVASLGGESSGLQIKNACERTLVRSVFLGQVYIALARLEAVGAVSASYNDTGDRRLFSASGSYARILVVRSEQAHAKESFSL